MPEQHNLLQIRIIHLLLRLCGADLGPSKTVTIVSWNPKQAYLHRNWRREALDLTLTMTDIAAQSPYKKLLPLMLHTVAKSLEWSCNYREAAAVLEEALGLASQPPLKDSTIFNLSDGSKLTSSVYYDVELRSTQSLMLTLCRDWEKAEETALHSVKVLFQSLDVEHAVKEHVFPYTMHVLTSLYRTWIGVLPDGPKAKMLHDVFSIVYVVSDMLKRPCDPRQHENILVIKPILRDRRKLGLAFKDAFLESKSAASFRRSIYALKHEFCKIDMKRYPTDSLKDLEQRVKEDARHVQAQLDTEMDETTRCHAPKCRSIRAMSKILRCQQCKSALYW
jgi:hypothetical protein